MANEEVLGPRKTMFVLVIVVGCFAVLWPRILSPLLLGSARDQLKPNQFDREAGCCEVMFEAEVAILELINEVCNTVVQADVKISPYAAAECRKAVNETCGVDIAAFLKRDENVGKTSKKLVNMMKSSNSSCLKEHFGIPQWSMGVHLPQNSWIQQDTLKQERPTRVGPGPHPALRERGRAIPPGPPAPPRPTITMPPHARPPPIPGMRPPLGSPGGPVPAPKSSMGFVMPIYTICIIVFFVYTLSKILFKRTGSTPYEPVAPDPQFRRRVFRDNSRTSPDKLGPKERDTRDDELEALRARLAETERAMQRIVGQLAKRDADLQDNHARPYTNGTVLHNTGPVHIVASEYSEESKEKSPETAPKEFSPEPISKEPSPEPAPEPKEPTPEVEETSPEREDSSERDSIPELEESTPARKETTPDRKETTPERKETTPELKETTPDPNENTESPDQIDTKLVHNVDLIELTEIANTEEKADDIKSTEEFLDKAREVEVVSSEQFEEKAKEERTTPELLEEALKEDSSEKETEDDVEEQEKSSVKHEAEDVKSIFLETQIPQQARVLVAEFEDEASKPAKHSPMVVSGKMTLSLIQDAPRDTPDRDLESTVDDFTTASAVTQPAAEKDEELSDEEIEEEIEIEEIEEEVEEEEEEEEKPQKAEPQTPAKKPQK